jgi:hypothetical protein
LFGSRGFSPEAGQGRKQHHPTNRNNNQNSGDYNNNNNNNANQRRRQPLQTPVLGTPQTGKILLFHPGLLQAQH